MSVCVSRGHCAKTDRNDGNIYINNWLWLNSFGKRINTHTHKHARTHAHAHNGKSFNNRSNNKNMCSSSVKRRVLFAVRNRKQAENRKWKNRRRFLAFTEMLKLKWMFALIDWLIRILKFEIRLFDICFIYASPHFLFSPFLFLPAGEPNTYSTHRPSRWCTILR